MAPSFFSSLTQAVRKIGSLGRFGRRPGTAGALARRLLNRLRVIVGAGDRRRQDGKIQPLLFLFGRGGLARTATARTGRFGLCLRFGRGDYRLSGNFGLRLFSRLFRHGPLAAAVVPLIAVVAVIALVPVTAIAIAPAIPLPIPLIAGFVAAAVIILTLEGLFGANLFAALVACIEFVEILVETVFARTETLLLLLLTGAVVGQNAEIMIGKLQIIFRIHPIPGHLRVAGHILVFFKKLGRIATCAVVDTVAIIATAPVATIGTTIIVPAAIATTGLPVVDQELVLAFTLPSFAENTVQSPSSKHGLSTRPGKAPPDRGLVETLALTLPEALAQQRRRDFEGAGKRPFLSQAPRGRSSG